MNGSNKPLEVDGERFWDTVMSSARIGPGRAGGLRRLALSDSDKEIRDLFMTWCREAGCQPTVDAMGSIYARRAGQDNSLPPVLIGSHLDTQIAGGRFDGIVGVLAGLEILRTLQQHGIETRRPIEVVNWSNEEGARFQPPMLSSGVFAGVHDLDWALARTDADGVRFDDELKRIGYAGDAPVGGRPIDTYFELHIEQGPILDHEKLPVGVVTGSYAVRGLNIHVHGETAHTGPTPMANRRNALVGAALLIVALNEIGWAYAPEGKTTSSRIEVWPNLAGILPDFAQVTVDMRHPDPATVDEMLAQFEQATGECAEKAQVEIEIGDGWVYGSEAFDPECVALVRETAQELGIPHMDILSQAGHDAFHMTKIAPTAMIFSPCDAGITHNEAENTTLDEQLPAVNLLLHAVLKRANR